MPSNMREQLRQVIANIELSIEPKAKRWSWVIFSLEQHAALELLILIFNAHKALLQQTALIVDNLDPNDPVLSTVRGATEQWVKEFNHICSAPAGSVAEAAKLVDQMDRAANDFIVRVKPSAVLR